MQYKFDDENHIHTLDGKPLTGTSSVVGVLSKPLSWWASGKAVEKLGWTNPKFISGVERRKISDAKFEEINHMTKEQYLALLDEAYKAHSTSLKQSASKGTDLHAELEKFVKWRMGINNKDLRPTFDSQIKPFVDWSEKNVKRFLWSEAHCFDEELWIGGISDAGCELNDGRIAVIDFKSAKEAYPSHFLQDALYAIQIDKNGLWDEGGRMNKKLEKPIDTLIVVPFGAEVVTPEIRYNVEEYKQGGRDCVNLYRLLGMEKN